MDDAIAQLAAVELGGAVARALFHEASQASVTGVELADGRRVVVKAHRPDEPLEWLQEIVRVQMHLASRGLFAARRAARRRGAFDWAGLCKEREPALVGFTAFAFCVDWSRTPVTVTPLADARAFPGDERRLCGAMFAYARRRDRGVELWQGAARGRDTAAVPHPGFALERVVEPTADDATLAAHPGELYDSRIIAYFLTLRFSK